MNASIVDVLAIRAAIKQRICFLSVISLFIAIGQVALKDQKSDVITIVQRTKKRERM